MITLDSKGEKKYSFTLAGYVGFDEKITASSDFVINVHEAM